MFICSKLTWKVFHRLSIQHWKVGIFCAASQTESESSVHLPHLVCSSSQPKLYSTFSKFPLVECIWQNSVPTFALPWLLKTMEQHKKAVLDDEVQLDKGGIQILGEKLQQLLKFNVDACSESTMEDIVEDIQQFNSKSGEDSVVLQSRKRRIHSTKEEVDICKSNNKQESLLSDGIPRQDFKKLKKGNGTIEPDLSKNPKKSVLPKKLLQQVMDSVREQHSSPHNIISSIPAAEQATRFDVVLETELHWISHKPARLISDLDISTIAQSVECDANTTQGCAIHPSIHTGMAVKKNHRKHCHKKKSSKIEENMQTDIGVPGEALEVKARNDIGSNDIGILNESIADEGGTNLFGEPVGSDMEEQRQNDSDECDVSVLFSGKWNIALILESSDYNSPEQQMRCFFAIKNGSPYIHLLQ